MGVTITHRAAWGGTEVLAGMPRKAAVYATFRHVCSGLQLEKQSCYEVSSSKVAWGYGWVMRTEQRGEQAELEVKNDSADQARVDGCALDFNDTDTFRFRV